MQTFTHSLLHLAAHPEYAAPLREEIERLGEVEGWTKVTMQKMRKVDSFLREVNRYNGLSASKSPKFLSLVLCESFRLPYSHSMTFAVSMSRKALVDYTLSDGTFLPAGTFVACNAISTHYDSANYEAPHEFRPFRFADVREESVEESTKHQMVATSNDYLSFGHGRHAW